MKILADGIWLRFHAKNFETEFLNGFKGENQ